MLKFVKHLWRSKWQRSMVCLAGLSMLSAVGCVSNPGWQVHRLHGSGRQHAKYASSQVARPVRPSATPTANTHMTTPQVSYIWMNGQWVPMYSGAVPPSAPPPNVIMPPPENLAGSLATQQSTSQTVPPAPSEFAARPAIPRGNPAQVQSLQTQIEQSKQQLELLTQQLRAMQSPAASASLPASRVRPTSVRPQAPAAESSPPLALTRFSQPSGDNESLTIPAIDHRVETGIDSKTPNSLDLLSEELEVLKGQTKQAVSAQSAVERRVSVNRDAQIARLRDIVAKLSDRLDPDRKQAQSSGSARETKTASIRQIAGTSHSSPSSGIDALKDGRAAFNTGDYDTALRHFNSAESSLDSDQQRGMAQYMAATCLRRLNRPEEAVRKYEQLADSNTDLAEYAQWQIKTIRWKSDLDAHAKEIESLSSQ